MLTQENTEHLVRGKDKAFSGHSVGQQIFTLVDFVPGTLLVPAGRAENKPASVLAGLPLWWRETDSESLTAKEARGSRVGDGPTSVRRDDPEDDIGAAV